MVFLISIFGLYIEVISNCGFLNLQFVIFIKIKLMPCHVYLLKQIQDYSKSFFTHIGQDFDHLYAFFHLYLIHFNPRITTLTMDYGIPTISTLSISLFFHGQGFPNMSTLAQNTFIVFWYSFQGAFLAIFHAKLSLIFCLFLQAIPFIRLPTLMEFPQAQV